MWAGSVGFDLLRHEMRGSQHKRSFLQAGVQAFFRRAEEADRKMR